MALDTCTKTSSIGYKYQAGSRAKLRNNYIAFYLLGLPFPRERTISPLFPGSRSLKALGYQHAWHFHSIATVISSVPSLANVTH